MGKPYSITLEDKQRFNNSLATIGVQKLYSITMLGEITGNLLALRSNTQFLKSVGAFKHGGSVLIPFENLLEYANTNTNWGTNKTKMYEYFKTIFNEYNPDDLTPNQIKILNQYYGEQKDDNQSK